MNRWVLSAIAVCGLLTISAVLNVFMPERLTQERILASTRAAAALDEVRSLEERRLSRIAAEATPAFQVLFECSNGEFVVECRPDWAPLGAARFREAVEQGVYDGARFFRVVPDFVVQFGIPGDPEEAAKWRNNPIKDDPVKQTNAKGTVTFATSGADSRTTQLFINLSNNTGLDGRGFAPIGRVTRGMNVVDGIFQLYGQEPSQARIQTEGNAYLKESFPKMDYIKDARILESESDG